MNKKYGENEFLFSITNLNLHVMAFVAMGGIPAQNYIVPN